MARSTRGSVVARPSHRSQTSRAVWLAPVVLCLAGSACTARTPEGSLPARPVRAGNFDVMVPPLSLTASDGTGLKLVSLTARGVVQAPLAVTELHLEFENPTDRTIEGRFEITMPPHAAISRFAMEIGGVWQEGEVVERRAAQVAFEDALHRKQDPALLENKAGNAFSARVFPIQPREHKHLIVTYSQELTSSSEPYRLMLRGLPELENLDANILVHQAGTSETFTLKRKNWTPDQDFEVQDTTTTAQVAGLRFDNLAVARVAAAGTMPAARIDGLTVLLDTSASRALDFDRQLVGLADLIATLRIETGEDFALRVICFDQTTEEVYSGAASSFGASALERISTRRPLGASNLQAALLAAGQGTVHPRLLVISDGIATAGLRELSDLQTATQVLVSAGVRRVDAIVDGGIQDAGTLKALHIDTLPQTGIVVDGRLKAPVLARKLASATLPPVKVEIPGAVWVWPETVHGVQPGDELLVYADLPAEVAMTVVLTGDTPIEVQVPTRPAERPLLERAWIGAQISRLTDQRSKYPSTDTKNRDDLRNQIITMSTRHRVLSDFTALLVLESDWDYQRFGIDRNALSDILTVGDNGVTLLRRSAASPLPQQFSTTTEWPTDDSLPPSVTAAKDLPSDADPPPEHSRHLGEEGKMGKPPGAAAGGSNEEVWGGLAGNEIGESFGVDGLGLIGTGRGGGGTGEGTIGLGNTGLIGKGGGGGSGSGYGRGAGAGFGGRKTGPIPTVRQAKAEVLGALDKDIIRRIVRAHINEVRYCYNLALERDPRARGRVSVRFVINSSGKVIASELDFLNIDDLRLGDCVANAIKRWTFPKPSDGESVTVLYPFVLENTGGLGPEPTTKPPPLSAADKERLQAFKVKAEAAAAEAAKRDAEARAAAAAAEAQARARREAEELRRAATEKIREAERASEAREMQRTEGSPYFGTMFDVMQALQQNDTATALTRALQWREEKPDDVLALVALGEVLEAAGDKTTAARAYGSIIDLFPARADLRRYVGGRFEKLGAYDLAVDTYAQAVAQRPDHPASHRLYAYALARTNRHAEAFAAIRAGIEQTYPAGRFLGAERILREDASLLAAAWLAAEPARATEIRSAAGSLNIAPDAQPSLRFVLTWETDANDVDFHIIDNKDQRAWYAVKTLPSGGTLYDDVVNGYGPECFAIPGKAAAFPYNFQAQYFSRGPMGYGMGKLQIVEHDGHGNLFIEDRPFLIMKDRAYVELGHLAQPLSAKPTR